MVVSEPIIQNPAARSTQWTTPTEGQWPQLRRCPTADTSSAAATWVTWSCGRYPHPECLRVQRAGRCTCPGISCSRNIKRKWRVSVHGATTLNASRQVRTDRASYGILCELCAAFQLLKNINHWIYVLEHDEPAGLRIKIPHATEARKYEHVKTKDFVHAQNTFVDITEDCRHSVFSFIMA